jgi:acetolactate synthase I/II/III large subunit
MWESHFPRAMLQSSALCTMGCALPLGMGHRLADPSRPVVVFVGDAGLEMGLGELATLRDLGLPVIVCVLVDESLALIELKQRATQRPNSAVDFGGSDFPAVARALGGHGVWIDDAETLKREATAALLRETFTLLACRIGRRAYDGLI